MLKSLKETVKGFPRLPGVYLMRNADGQVIYVGKAKDLRARIRSYFAGGDGRAQIEYLLSKVSLIEKIVTENENQAFVLERDLITKYKPRYNIRLKDDKAYLSIRIDENLKWPKLELVRRVNQDGARYFGPFASGVELKNILDLIKRTIPLRSCTDTVFHNRVRPCLEYQIKRCLGPCCLEVQRDEYTALLKQAISILQGKTEYLAEELNKAMQKASEQLRFEDAALYRDRLNIVQNFKQGQSIVGNRAEDRDVFALYREDSNVALVLMRVRLGRISDSVTFSFANAVVSDAQILESAITQYYEGEREVPEEIIVPYKPTNLIMLSDFLAKRRGNPTQILTPSRGIRLRSLKLAELNAQEHFKAVFEGEARYVELSKEMALQFKLRQLPRRVECVDISNFGPSSIVGAVVSFFDGVMDRRNYRRYKIKSVIGKPDDFQSMHEVVSRRLQRGARESDLPDLLVIDGGAGQLSMALKARDELNIKLDIIALAKERIKGQFRSNKILKAPERVFIENAAGSLALKADSKLTHFLSRVRDEAHRYVIAFHRRTRNKRTLTSVLDAILGLGPERKGRLLRAYGTTDNMRRIPAQELAKTGRMPLSLANKVLRKLGVHTSSQ